MKTAVPEAPDMESLQEHLPYDSTGNLTDVIFLDSAGQPVRGEDRYARYHAEYDAYGNCIQEEYFNETVNRIIIISVMQKQKPGYDGRGFQTFVSGLLPNGTPVAEKNKASMRRRKPTMNTDILPDRFTMMFP